MATEEQLAWRKRWIEALRSGEYKQGQGQLVSCDVDNQLTHCCLGVLCEVLGVKRDSWGFTYVTEYGWLGLTNKVLPPSAAQAVGLSKTDGRYFASDSGRPPLADKNDDGTSFSRTADIIESNPSASDSGFTSLVDKNDDGTSFSRIADIIESNPPGLWEDN